MTVVLNDEGIEILFLESIIPSNDDKNMIMVFYGIIWEFMEIVNRIG